MTPKKRVFKHHRPHDDERTFALVPDRSRIRRPVAQTTCERLFGSPCGDPNCCES